MSLRDELIQVAAVAVAIVQDLDEGHTKPVVFQDPLNRFPLALVLQEVSNERHNQEQKWGPQHHTPEEWLAILAEEVGEAAREVADLLPYISHQHVIVSLDQAEQRARAFLKERFGQ